MPATRISGPGASTGQSMTTTETELMRPAIPRIPRYCCRSSPNLEIQLN